MAGSLELRLLSDIQKAVCCAAKEQTPSVVIWQQEITDASGENFNGDGTSLEIENFDDTYWIKASNGTITFLIRPGGSKVIAFGSVFTWGTITLYAVAGPSNITSVIPSASVYAQVTRLSQT
jgi:hypothetical protein